MQFRAPFLRPFFPRFSPLFPLQALFTLPSLLPSSPPPLSPLFVLPESSDLGTPLILVLFSVLLISPNSCVALRGLSLRGFGDVRGFPSCGGKKGLRLPLAIGKRVWDSLVPQAPEARRDEVLRFQPQEL